MGSASLLTRSGVAPSNPRVGLARLFITSASPFTLEASAVSVSTSTTSTSSPSSGLCSAPPASEVRMGRWYCPFAADSWSLGVCLLALAAPREYDEYEMDRTPFYPFTCADADEDDEFAIFVAAPRFPPPQQPQPEAAPRVPPPGLPMPPGLILGPPPPGLAAPPSSPAAAASAVARLLEQRACMCGLEPPGEPPMPLKMLEVLDALLMPEPGMRLPVADAAVRLQRVVME